MMPDDRIDKRLATNRVGTRDIDIVVQSHLHSTMPGGLQWLTHAPILVQREELSFALQPLTTAGSTAAPGAGEQPSAEAADPLPAGQTSCSLSCPPS